MVVLVDFSTKQEKRTSGRWSSTSMANQTLVNVSYLYWTNILFTLKSTIADCIMQWYEQSDYATWTSRTEKVFGLANKYNKFVIVSSEVSQILDIDEAEFQALVTGETVTIPMKGKTAVDICWKVPMFFLGNHLPDNWQD